MTREQVFLAVLTGVVARGPKFKARQPGHCGPAEVDYDRMIKITNNVTDAVMGCRKPHESRPTWDETQTLLAQRLLSEFDVMKNNRDALAAEVDRLNECLGSSHEAHNMCVKTVEAKEFKILELEEEIKRLESELDKGAECLDRFRNEVARLQADKDALRKAVEDGAMEIERLKNTLKGVDQIVRMKPEDVEMLKAEWDKIEKKGDVIVAAPTCGAFPVAANFIKGELCSVGPVSDHVVDIKNDLSSAVANSTEGQRVVVEDLEATVEADPEEWVILDRETYGQHVMRKGVDQWRMTFYGDDNSTEDEDWCIADSSWEKQQIPITGRSKLMVVRCRRKDIPVMQAKDAEVSSVVAAEDPEEWVTQDRVHMRPHIDETRWVRNDPCDRWAGDWKLFDGLTTSYKHGAAKTGDKYYRIEVRCRRKHLPVAPPAAESQS